jgi:geranylgeranyl diphosphate synthase type I
MSDVPFADRLAAYKHRIDVDIASYAQHAKNSTRSQFGAAPADISDVFFDVLGRGGKRIRGSLAIVAYEMCGGTDREMIVRAATALEMLNAYILMIDDIQDRSKLRRGKATAHEMLAGYIEERNLKGDPAHIGMSLTLNAAVAGNHAAQTLLAGLSVDPELRTKVLAIVNQAMVVTAQGQTQDIMNELYDETAQVEIDHVLEWKTAYYSFLNPLCTGMVLAGADCADTDAIREYAIPTGMAFQITDDIIGIYGDDMQTGKGAMDDIREGKQTILTQYALEHAEVADKRFLLAMLGNDSLTPAEFDRCKQIVTDTGALEYARHRAKDAVAKAFTALDEYEARWQPEGVAFLRGLALKILDRTA